MTTEGRQRLITEWGPEVVVRCCRDWPMHMAHLVDGRGLCGICKQRPTLVVGLTWEDMIVR